MKYLNTAIAATLTLCLSGCSTTPGDAAYRGGHFSAAADLYKQGAEQGDISAMIKLGNMYQNGQGVTQSDQDAVHWFEKAANSGSAVGMHNLGVANEYGIGCATNYAKAAEWYLKAAEKGYAPAQYNLGSLYANGFMTPPDNLAGYTWLLIAKRSVARTDPNYNFIQTDPPGHAKKLASLLTAEQLAEAEAMAEKWKPTGS